MNEYVKVLQNYVGFEGRATRKEYWMFVLINLLISIVLGIIQSVAHLSQVLTGIYTLAVLLPSLAVSVRRLHDTGRSGWFLLLAILPIIGHIILLVFFCLPTKVNDQTFGPANNLTT